MLNAVGVTVRFGKRVLFEEKINLPVKVLLAKSYLDDSIDISELPDSILLINSYMRTYCSYLQLGQHPNHLS